MFKPRLSLRATFAVYTVALILVSVVGKREYVRWREKQVRSARLDLAKTSAYIDNGTIHQDMSVKTYLRLTNPCDVETLGPYTKYFHGATGGLSNGIVVIAKGKRLVSAYSWSCMGEEVFFNTLTDSDEFELATFCEASVRP